MEWNSIQLAQQFLQRANALHPDDEPGNYDETLARQDLYYECYMTAFSKEQLGKMLEKAMHEEIKLPEENDRVDAVKYRNAYRREAELVFNKFLKTTN